MSNPLDSSSMPDSTSKSEFRHLPGSDPKDALSPPEKIEKHLNPYPGLRPFEEDDSTLFFGRVQHVSDLLGRLTSHKFLAVVGVSGSGKSSLVRAGLIPVLRQG